MCGHGACQGYLSREDGKWGRAGRLRGCSVEGGSVHRRLSVWPRSAKLATCPEFIICKFVSLRKTVSSSLLRKKKGVRSKIQVEGTNIILKSDVSRRGENE